MQDAFTTADDPDNSKIPCALSLLAYELYPNLLAILRFNTQSNQLLGGSPSTTGLPHKLQVLAFLNTLAKEKPSFLVAMRRFEDDI